MSTNIVIYALIPVVSALIGWITNYLAVKMIFRPRKMVRILGIPVIGLIPKRKSDLAQKIGETVERELVSHKDIQRIIGSRDFHDDMIQAIRTKIDDFFTATLLANPLLGLLLSSDLQSKIRQRLVEELENAMPDMMDSLLRKIEGRIDFKEIVREKVDGFDLGKLETIVYSIASRELKAIELFGGVLGFVVGLGQVGLLALGGIYG